MIRSFICNAIKQPMLGFRTVSLNHVYQTRSFTSLRKQNQQILMHKNVSFISQRNIHPVILLVGRQVVKVVAILTGRYGYWFGCSAFRKWWRQLPEDQREYYAQRFRANRKKVVSMFDFKLVGLFIVVGLSLLAGGLVVYYASHIEETPITKRKRFIAFSNEQFNELSQFEFNVQYEMYKKHLLPTHHPYPRRVSHVAMRLLNANLDVEQIHDKKWTVSVVDAPIKNAFVLPCGQIFVFTGMLEMCSNDDQLGCILAHEMAHSVLSHGSELLSYAHLVDMWVIMVLGMLWAFMPTDILAVVAQFFFHKIVELLLHMPYNRQLEAEADLVGLELAAKACFDVREASAFWSKMSLAADLEGDFSVALPEFLSTHPSNETRSEILDSVMNQAIKKRMECNCPPLPRLDPRDRIDHYRKQLEMHKRAAELHRDGVIVLHPTSRPHH